MLRIAHRGASGYAPENTLSAFKKALELGADGVELDVHRCASGELVVIHDDTVDRTTDGKGDVSDLTLSELRGLHITGNEHIPTLDEALAILAGRYVFVEVKHGTAALEAAALIQHYVGHGVSEGRLWLISFDHECLKMALTEYPSLHVGAGFESLEETSIKQAHAWGARAITPHYQSFSAAQLRQAQALELKVVCWTVNEPGDIRQLRAMGVDGIMSDYPDRL